MKRRAFSFISALALCLNLCPAWAFAAAAEPDTGLCPHHPAHTADCGYVPDDPGSACTFVCRICPMEDLIAALPDSVTADNSEQVSEQLDEILALYNELSEEELEQVDLSPCFALMEQIEGLDAGKLDDYTLDSNMSESVSRVYSTFCRLNTNGHTLTNTNTDENTSAIVVTGAGQLEFCGNLVCEKNTGVRVESGGTLRITGESSIYSKQKYAVYIAQGANVQLGPGTYTGNMGAIYVANGNYTGLLEEGYAFYDTSGNVITTGLASVKILTVKQCTDHAKTYAHDSDAPTHTWTCKYCGASGEPEPCAFEFERDGDGTSTCGICGNGISINVNQDDLSNLVYDGTLKPTDVRVVVTLTDGTELAKDDYTVKIDSIKDAGQATVTVTGKTFTGSFVKTYTVKQDEPGIKWDNTSYTVDYDGSAVTTGELPPITIGIKSNEDLHPLLKYAYKTVDGADFTDGLPTNAGTYQVKAYLEESQNYKAAETNPLLTLTINKINPIVTPPAAKTLTYNHSVQELVSAGALDPVAIAEGLEIQFATSNSGPWSTDVPKGTNAGNYTVWYQVTGLTDNYIAPASNPAQVNVMIQRKQITPVVTLSPDSFQYDGEEKQPAVTVKDGEYDLASLRDIEYTVTYTNNRNVSTDANPAKVTVADKLQNGGNYDITQVVVPFKITKETQDTLTITNKPNTITYGSHFTLETTGGSDSGSVTWKITDGADVATVGENSGQVTITGHGTATVKATKSGGGNYEDATDTWTFTAEKKPVTAVVTAEGKVYDSNDTAKVTATLQSGDFVGTDSFTIKLAGKFEDASTGENKKVTVDSRNPVFTVNAGGTDNHEHYDITYPTSVIATITKAPASIKTQPVAANLTYNGSERALIATRAVTNPAGLPVEYALSQDGTYSTDFPKGTDAGTYTVWYRVRETDNYTGTAPDKVSATIAKKSVNPTIELDEVTFPYDGTAKTPAVTLKEADGTLIPTGEYTVAYSNNTNVGTNATVTVTVKDDGNYSFTPVTKGFTITDEQAKVLTAPKPAGDHLIYKTYDQDLVIPGTAEGGTMVYSVDNENGTYSADVPRKTDAGTYKVYYKVQGDSNHSDSATEHVKVIIDPRVVDKPTIELQDGNGSKFERCTYDGNPKTVPKVVVKEGSTVIADAEYNIVYSNNKDAGTANISITDNVDGNYTVTGSATFIIDKADIVFNPDPSAADLTYTGEAQELLKPGKTSGCTVLYALNSETAQYHDYIPTGTNPGTYTVYYKAIGDNNHNNFDPQSVSVAINPKPVTAAITVNNKPHDGNNTATVTAANIDAGLVTVGGIKDEVIIDPASITATFDNSDVGTRKTVTLDTSHVRVTGKDANKYAISYPATVTAEIKAPPSEPGGDTGNSSTTTNPDGSTTTTNPDGSTTTTTEDKTTGTVTETTKNPDGSTSVVETQKNGTVTTTETDKDGNKTETVANPDGSSEVTVEQKDGTTATVNTDTEGKVAAKVTLPEEVVAAAQEGGKAIILPIPEVQANSAASAETAPVVTVNTGSDKPVKVIIPTTEARPGTVAVIVNADGTEEVIKTSVSTEDGLAVTLPNGATVKIVDNSKAFNDSPTEDWSSDAVAFVSARELFTGTSQDTFSPDQPMTRAMMVTVLARLDGADTSGGNTWYEQGVNWAVSKGITDGSNPGANISREQLAVMLWRYAGKPTSAGDLDSFGDASSVSGYAKDAMRWAVENGIIKGNDDEALNPKGGTTRAEVAQILKNFVENT